LGVGAETDKDENKSAPHRGLGMQYSVLPWENSIPLDT
jgi:hypothetical protein